MKGILLTASCFVLCVLAGAEARAAAPHCTTLERVQKAAGEAGRLSHRPLTGAQFFYLRGLMDGNPQMPDAPDADGAILFTRQGQKTGVVVWTLGPLACGEVEIPEALIKQLAKVQKGAAAGEAL